MTDDTPTDVTPDAAAPKPDHEPALGNPFALLAEFPDVDSVMHAAEAIRDKGFTIWDVHSPFPIHGINKAMGLRPTILPWIVLIHGLFGAAAGFLLVWWTNATTFTGVPTPLQGYAYFISGKPIFSLLANIPIIFETTILFAAFGTVLGMFGLNKLPQLSHPLFQSAMFRGVTDDRFVVVIETEDPLFDPDATPELMRSLGAVALDTVHDEMPSDRPNMRKTGESLPR